MEIKKEGGLGLAITIKDGKIQAKMKMKGINQFEAIGLLFSQILSIEQSIKKETIKKE